jgi:hypothetical protein
MADEHQLIEKLRRIEALSSRDLERAENEKLRRRHAIAFDQGSWTSRVRIRPFSSPSRYRMRGLID